MLDIEEDKGEITMNINNTMSQVEINKAIIQRYFEAYNNKNEIIFDEIIVEMLLIGRIGGGIRQPLLGASAICASSFINRIGFIRLPDG